MCDHWSLQRSRPIILNFLPLGTGGGLQNALSFLTTLVAEDPERMASCVALVKRDSEVHRVCRESGIPHYAASPGISGRLCCEMGCRSILSPGRLCFTLFGPPMLRSSGHVINVNGCAYSNLFYPEIPFWSHVRGRARLKVELVDMYRRSMMQRADYWIFETEVLRQRAIQLCGFPTNRTGVVRMAPSTLVDAGQINPDARRAFEEQMPEGFRFLFLNGPNPNKRMHLLADIAGAMRDMGLTSFCFVATLDASDPYTHEVDRTFADAGLSKFFRNIGPVRAHDVPNVIACVGAMCTFSALESFSNNFVEAWKMEVPLVVSDADWARESCGEAAIYADPRHAWQCATKLCQLARDAELRHRVVSQGRGVLSTYPTATEKVQLYFKEMEKARCLGSCSEGERSSIHWPSIVKSDQEA